MTDLNQRLWPLLDSHGEPLTLTNQLADVSWIREAAPASTIVCPECLSMHEEQPIARPNPDGTVHLYIPCPDLLRVEISPSDLRRWVVDLTTLARHIAQSIGVKGHVKQLRPGRLWRLGHTKWQQTSRDVLLARGLHWQDAGAVIRQIERCTHPIVLVPNQIPDEDIWMRRPAVIALSHVSHLSHDGLEINHTHLFASVADQMNQRGGATLEITSSRKHTLMIRRQVKAEIGSMLEDDAFVAAYEQHGSYRKAAEALSEQTGQRITKDRIYRAIQRRGGPRAVRSNTNSHSVRRTVASQRQDGHRKIQNRPEAVDVD